MTMVRKLLLAGVLTAGMTAFSACSSGDEGDDQSAPEDQESSQEETDNSQESESEEPSSELSSNEDLKGQLESKDSVEEAMVQEVDGDDGKRVNIDITLASGQELSDDLKSTYSDMIREVYPDQTVDVIYAQGEEMLEQTTLE